MKIFDCFIYCDEDLILDLRLNYLDQYVDKFIIVESTYTHSGASRKLNFILIMIAIININRLSLINR